MSIRIYDKDTGKWVVQASNQASEILLVDVQDNFQSGHVEGALREVATSLENQKLDTETLQVRVDNIADEVEGVIADVVDNQLITINKRLDNIDEDIEYLMQNGGGGGGSTIVPTITSDFEADVIEQGQSLSINIFFTSPALGEGTAYIIINGIETGTQAVRQGSNNIKVGVLPNLENTVSIYVKDRSGMMTNQLTWKIISGGINATIDFDDTADYPFGEDIRMPFTIETASTEPIVMHLTVGSTITQVACEKGYNEYTFKNLGVGIHKVSFYFTSGKYKTKTYNFNLVIVNSKNLYVSSTFEGGEFEFGVPLSIDYRISKLSTELFDVNLIIDGEVTKTLQVTAGSYYWTISSLALGEHTLKIEASSISGEYSSVEFNVTIVEGEYTPANPVMSGLVAWFDANERTNQDTSKETWTDKTGNGNIAKLHNFNYYSNGWIDNELVCDGDAYVEIDMTPYKDNVKLGSTIDIQFTAYNIGLEEARVLDYTGKDLPHKGIYINTLETKLTSLTSNGKVSIDEDTETRLTYVIDRDGKFAKIYVDGVLCRAFQLSDSGSGTNKLYEDFTHSEKIYLNSQKGLSNFGKCKIKNLRIYERALSHDEVLQNHIADIKDLEKQKEIYNFNYNNFTTPTIHLYSTENGNFDNMTNLVQQEIRVKYTSPNEDLYGKSFDLPYCQVQWQGTSSIAYVLKNYQIWLKDENKADYYYTPFQNSKPEKVLTIKADYMESTHSHNTGLAKFVNECLYDTKSPPQLIDEEYRNSVTGFPVLCYIDNELVGVYNFNLDRYSTESLGYKEFPNCLSYEISANSDTTAGAFFKWTPESGKTELDYLKSDFECRYPETRAQGDDTFDEMKRLVDWVSDATDEQFKEQFSQYLNLEYTIRYYLFTLFVGAVDNLGKNMMITTFDGLVWYPQFYDLDTTLGIDNTGFLKFDCDIEMKAGIFNTSNSNLWTKLQRVFEAEIKAEYAKMRQRNFTEENLMKYLYGEQISQIPQRNYNQDMQTKYLNFGNQFLHALHGNGYSHMKRWVRERLFFLDTLLEYTISSSDYITIRANKQGSVYLDIQTYVPMYARVKWRDEANNTGTQIKKINRGETVRFTYTMPTATDQEVLVYGGKYLKDVGDLTNLQPTTLLISKAPKLTRLVCTNNPNLINTDLSNCTMLQSIDLHGCTNLGGGIGSNPTLNVQKCTNLRSINIYDTKLTAIYTNTSGGNLQEINYPFTVQTVQIHNQPNLTSIGIPVNFVSNGHPNNRFAKSLVSVDIANCTNLTSMVKNYYTNNGEEVPVPTFLGVSSAQSFKISNSLTNLEKIDLSYCANLRSLSISDFYSLSEINFDDIGSWDALTSNLSEVNITNCPNVETITFNQNTIDGTKSLGVAFAQGTTLDLSNLLRLKHIRSNVGVKGLQKLILPPTVTSLVFNAPENTKYSQQSSDIHTILSIDAMYKHQNDDYTGMDLLGMSEITDFSMGSLTNVNSADNLNIKITNTFPYFNYFRSSDFFKPTGRVDISDYTGSLAHLFKGIDMDKLEIVCDKQLTQNDASYMFAYASANSEDKIHRLFEKMQNITNLSYMFYNGHITKAPTIPLTTTDCRYMFYNCGDMIETPANWLQSYVIAPLSDYCYTGCANIQLVDGEASTLDEIPSAWGGFGRSDKGYTGYEIQADNTLERLIENASASGLTIKNEVEAYSTTPIVTHDQSSFAINEGMDARINIKEEEYDKAVLKGYSLTNLIGARGETQEFERLVQDFTMTDGLVDGVDVIDSTFVEASFSGNTLQNIVMKDGITPEIIGTTSQFGLNDNNSDGVLMTDGDYQSLIIKGNTLTNVVPEFGQSEIVEVCGDVHVNDAVNNEHIAISDGHMEVATIKGNTIINIARENGQTGSVEITGTANVNDLVSEDIITCDGEMEKAIIKGRSLNNLYSYFHTGTQNTMICERTENNTQKITGTNSSYRIRQYSYKDSMEIDKIYTIIIEVFTNTVVSANSNVTLNFCNANKNNGEIIDEKSISEVPLGNTGKTGVFKSRFKYRGVGMFNVNINILKDEVFEYRVTILEGDYYDTINHSFYGIGSVKMPVLRTTGKNLFNINIFKNESDEFGFPYEKWKMQLKPNTTYIANSSFTRPNNDKTNYDSYGAILNGSKQIEQLYLYHWNLNLSFVNKTFTTDDTGVIYLGVYKGDCPYNVWDMVEMQIEEGSTATSYEPYKSNILTVNEPIELRGIGDVKDELNLLTGELTSSLGEVVLDGTQKRMGSQGWGNYTKTRFELIGAKDTRSGGDDVPLMSDKLKPYGYWGEADKGEYFFTGNNYIDIVHSNEKDIVQWLKDNPTLIIYPLIESTIKTVDLSDQPKPYAYKDGYVSISSSELTPTIECTLPTSNYYEVPRMKNNTQYTLYFEGEPTSVNVGGNEVQSPTSPMLVTSGSQKNLKFDKEVDKVMLIEGDSRKSTPNYFTGVLSVVKPILASRNAPRAFGKGGKL